jgi:6-phosphogluconolactonase
MNHMSSLNHKSKIQTCRWHPFSNAAELEQAAVAEIELAARRAIDARGAFSIVLSGGTTPCRVYESLRDIKTKWSAWHIYFGDERCLPVDDAERNSHMAALAWLNHVDIPASQIHPIPAESGASGAAQIYARIVNKIGPFDLVLLGLGEDGHTASLFPDHDFGDSPDAPATLTIFDAPKLPPQRVSLSAQRLSDAREVMFLIAGSSKVQAVKAWRSGQAIPAVSITPDHGVDVYIEAGAMGTAEI